MSSQSTVYQLAEQALVASRQVALLNNQQKNHIITAMAEALLTNKALILRENQKDIVAATEKNLSTALIDRLRLNDKRIDAIVEGLQQICQLDDPVGTHLETIKKDNGLTIDKVSVPIGVICVIYESRPNVTVDVSGLCLKAGNSIILRGGSDAYHSNQALFNSLIAGGKTAGLPEHAIQMLPTTNREAVSQLLQLDDKVDLVIPRGGEGLIRAVTEMSTIPVIKHYKGLCHVYVDSAADVNMAIDIVENAKCQRPGVCNAIETLLIHDDIIAEILPRLAKRLLALGVALRGDQQVCQLLPDVKPATIADWQTEYLDLILSIKSVSNIDAAISHINHYGSHHSDTIITHNPDAAQQFLQQVDSACVYVNASTRFTDGYEFAMGAEIGISTDKLHARGPMGLKELTSYKYLCHGNGQIRP